MNGSVAQRLDTAGTVLTSHLWDAYGSGSASGAWSDPVGYGAQWGYYRDAETGLYLLTHRYYDPGTGRFLTRDPISYAGGINLYGYCGNEPVDWADPDGLNPLWPIIRIGIGNVIRAGAGRAGGSMIRIPAPKGKIPGIGEAVDMGRKILDGIRDLGKCFAKGKGKDAGDGQGEGEKTGGPAEHTKNDTPSNREKHEKGEASKKRDKPGGEKGDRNRRNNKKRGGQGKMPKGGWPMDGRTR